MRVTGVGGGHGLASTLRAARLYADEIAAVVTVADNGGSSGRLTRDLGIPPPGDIRNCLVALADESPTTRLWQHRFESGALAGHTVGNLVITALAEIEPDFASAVRAAGELLGASGVVYPATSDLVSLRARVDGGVVRGQVAVAETEAPIQAVYLEPREPRAHPGAVGAILEADQVILGPGSLFTSLIATLLVPDLRRALIHSAAHRVFVCNARMQAGETQGLGAAAHVEALLAHLGPYAIDSVVLQSPMIADEGVAPEAAPLVALGLKVVEADVAAPDGTHDPVKLARVLGSLS
ncbi:MAG: uridine diphosphate-N-acetylglucosamine-binding protein YvcK [Actinomycetota bacterium]|nr:uridine diphosphate-N-acetylglucosamine-binding protein YvcK [Actinomycetota bacterium]